MSNFFEFSKNADGTCISIRKEHIIGVALTLTQDLFFRISIFSEGLSNSEEFKSQAEALARYKQIMDALNT
jgi:hypothetical protein